LEKEKQRMNKAITAEEIDLLCQTQRELVEFQKGEQLVESKIEISSK
jgi:hypothetical protein